jgi:DNA-binding CsgD family transcriptional regulator
MTSREPPADRLTQDECSGYSTEESMLNKRDSRQRQSWWKQDAQIRADVASSPKALGYPAASWTGELLSRHLGERFNVELSARQGRRVLRDFGITPPPKRRNSPSVREPRSEIPTPSKSSWDFGSRGGKARHQTLALRKIQRLASSGLPLYPFVLALFDIMDDALAMGDTPRAITTAPELGSSWVFANLDQSKWVPILSTLTQGHAPAAPSTFRPLQELVRTRQTVFCHEEFTLPDYKRSALYNEFLRPLKLEHGSLLQLMSQGELVGYYPLYRDAVMKAFDQDDLRFLTAVAPHIAHGLQTAKLIKTLADSPAPDAARQPPGVAVMRHDGRVVGLDARARSLFFQVGMHDGIRWPAFAEPQLRSILTYVASKLRAVFGNSGLSATEVAPPTTRIFSHHAGIALKLTGHNLGGETKQSLFVVLVEQVEPESFRHARLMYRYGLGAREAEVLIRLRRGFAVSQIGKQLGITTPTAKTYVRNLIAKLDVPDLRTLRAEHFALAN